MSYRKLHLVFGFFIVALAIFLVFSGSSSQASPNLEEAGSADWPMPQYDVGRSRSNPFELSLLPPFDPMPAQEIKYLGTDADRPSAVIADDMLFWYKVFDGATEGEMLVATDLSGQKIWGFDTPSGHVLGSAPPVVDGEEVFAVEHGVDDVFNIVTNVVALDRQTGALLWRHPIHLGNDGSGRLYFPIAVQDRIAYFSWEDEDTFTGYIFAVDARTGAEIWTTEVDNVGSHTADLMVITNNVLVGLHFSYLVAYDLATGVEMWELDTYEGTGLIASTDDLLAVDGKVAVINSRRVGVYAVSDGEMLWSDDYYSDTCERDSQMQMASDGINLSVTGMCGDQLINYDLGTGIEKWRETAHRTASSGNIVNANSIVYITAFDDQLFTEYIAAFDLITGQLIQRIDTDSFLPGITFVLDLAAANGQLFAAIPDVGGDPLSGTLYTWGVGSGNTYLPTYDNDDLPDTNPESTAEVSIIDRDGAYGAEIRIGAIVGREPATLRVYRSNGQLYKEAVGNPNAYGNGFWVAPLEYDADGYEYQVILSDDTELPVRQILMPADAASSVDFVVQTDSLAWQSPPTLITNAPHTLTLSLPGGFPTITTTTFAVFQSPDRGMVTVEGVRVADELKIKLDADTAVNGDFLVTAVASSGNLTAYSPDIDITIDSADLPDVRVGQISAVEPHRDGTATASTFSFDRQRPAVDLSLQADVQIASVVPDPSGYQVTMWVQTPPEDPLDPLTSKWEVGLSARDQFDNELDRISTEIPAAPDGIYMVMGVNQPGTVSIAGIQAFGSTLEGVSRTISTLPGSLLAPACTPPGGSGSGGPSKPPKISDFVGVTVDLGASGEAVAGAGVSTAAYVQGDIVSGQVQACAEGGVRVGGSVGGGPMAAAGATVNLRGSGHAAPANSGVKYDITVAAGAGIQLSYTVPDNFGDSGYGQLGIAVSAAPEAGLSGGATVFSCYPPQNEHQPNDNCCTGASCPPTPPNPPDPPGGDHPDDTKSIVLQNATYTKDRAYWRAVRSFAYSRGFTELADYAKYRQLDFSYIEVILEFPAGQPLTEEQQRIVRAYESNRLLSTAAIGSGWGTIVSQMAQLEATQANVLANGYYAEMQALLSSHSIPNRLISLDFSPDSVSGSMLVIPTAGLYGLGDDMAFAERLERFVHGGGTLLVMSQPGSSALDMLPGDWQQVDYHEDISCYVDAMSIIQYHPVLASVRFPTFTSHVDGYMTTFPASAQLLMERTKNQEGAFVLHEYGQGRMIVTNMYDDWGRTVGQSSPNVRDMFRDLVRWASIGGEPLPEVLPGQPVSMDVEVSNVVESSAAQLRWVVRKPNGLAVDSGTGIQNIQLEPGQSVNQVIDFTPGASDLGFWTLNFQLLDAVGEVVQGETLAGYFIVSDPPPLNLDRETAPTVELVPLGSTSADVILSLDQEAYLPGDPVTVTLEITLSDPGAVSGLKVVVSLGETTQEQIVSALASQEVVFNLPANFNGNGLLFYGVYESDAGQGLYLNTRWIQREGENVTVVPAEPSYTPGETVTLDITGIYTGSIFISAADFARTIEVSNSVTVTFDLPAVLSSGPVKVNYYDGGFQRTARFDVVGPRVTVTDMSTVQPVIAPGSLADIVAQVDSSQALDVQLSGRIVDGDGFVFPTVFITESLSAGEQTITMTMPISTTTSGSVRFEMTIADATKTAVTYVQAHRYLTIDAPVLQAVRAEGGQLGTSDIPEVLLDWYAPSGQPLEATLWLDGSLVDSGTINLSSGFSTTRMSLPSDLVPGSYALYAEADLGDGIITSAHSILLVVETEPSSLPVFLPLLRG